MNKYHLLLKKILEYGRFQNNKKGKIKYLLNQRINLSPAELLRIFEDHQIARKKLRKELELFTSGATDIEVYRENGIEWWNYCDNLHNSYPTYFSKLPKLVDRINSERRNSKNYVLFLGENDATTSQAPCLSLIQFQIDNGQLVISAYQRSSDANLGMPADVYHLYLISRMIDVPLRCISLTFGNVHIYDNNVDATYKLLNREPYDFNLNV